MNADRLLAEFHRLAEVPDAVARLRRFILDLAVRGKLVEQDPNDEPASVLLKRIHAEKERTLKDGIHTKARWLPRLEEQRPFRLPGGWAWTQLAEVGFLNPRNKAEDDLLASFVPMPSISSEYGVGNEHEVRPWGEIKALLMGV